MKSKKEINYKFASMVTQVVLFCVVISNHSLQYNDYTTNKKFLI